MNRLFISAANRLIAAILLGVVAAILFGLAVGAATGALVGITVVTTVFVILGTAVLQPMDAEATRAYARREDFRPVVDEIIITVAPLLGIGGIVGLLILGGSRAGAWPAAIALRGVFMSWAGLQLLYSVRCAFLCFDRSTPSWIDFNTGTTLNY